VLDIVEVGDASFYITRYVLARHWDCSHKSGCKKLDTSLIPVVKLCMLCWSLAHRHDRQKWWCNRNQKNAIPYHYEISCKS
jgi:hypothetical protein